MNSLIVAGVIKAIKKVSSVFKDSCLFSAINKINNKISSLWQNSVIMSFLRKDSANNNTLLKRIAFLPFTLLEALNKKFQGKISNMVNNSTIFNLADCFFHNFSAINTRFIGILFLSFSLTSSLFSLLGTGTINNFSLILSLICFILTFFNFNFTDYAPASRLIKFITSVIGLKDIKYDFYDSAKTVGFFRLIGAVLIGIISGFISHYTLIGVLIPFAVFGIIFIIKHPIAGVYGAVFSSPLISFSSMPLALLCFFTFVCVILKSLYEKDFVWKKDGVGISLILFLAVLLVSCLFSFSPAESLTVWMMYFIFITFYFAIINTIKTKAQLYSILRVFVISGAIVSLYGIMQYVFGWTTTNAWIDEEMFENETMRVFSTLANPNVLGEYLLLVLPVSAAFFINDKLKSLSKWVYLLITGLMFICLILTQSRGCWLGFVLCVAIFVTFYEGRLWALIPFVLCIMPFVLPQTIINRLMSIGDMGDSSTSYRVYIWLGTMGILKNYFLGGIGMGEAAYAQVYPLFSYNAVIAPHSHNTFLQLLVEGGISALLVFILIIILFLKSNHTVFKKESKKSLSSVMILAISSGIAGFLFQSMFDYTFYNYRVMAIFFMIIAIGVSFKYIQEGMTICEKDN